MYKLLLLTSLLLTSCSLQNKTQIKIGKTEVIYNNTRVHAHTHPRTFLLDIYVRIDTTLEINTKKPYIYTILITTKNDEKCQKQQQNNRQH